VTTYRVIPGADVVVSEAISTEATDVTAVIFPETGMSGVVHRRRGASSPRLDKRLSMPEY
jgi:hypothetical protein